jgi:N-acetylmuramoyl-L-alanine amidase
MLISKAIKQASEEKKFHNTLTGTGNTKFKAYEKVGTDIVKLDPGHDTYFYKTETKKDKIVIHSTAGYLRHDVVQLTQKDNKVSVNYVISRDGVIYELFDPKYWAYHLGRGASGGNKVNSSTSISIELCNIGPLSVHGDRLVTSYSTESRKDYYCYLSENEYYTKCDYRGYEYFASFPNEQYKALKYLLDYLCDEFDIPYEFVELGKRHDTFTASEAKAFKGICTHVNFRSSGKYDLGPFFDWSKLSRDILEPINEVHTNEVKEMEDESVISNDMQFELDEVSIKSGSPNYMYFINKLIEFVMKLLKK